MRPSPWRAGSGRLLDRVAAFPVPVIAALNGHALGGGAEVAVAADIRIAADDVKIGFNQVTLGIMPAWGGAERLAQLVGRSRALLAIATGDLYDAPTAQRFGLVDVVVPRVTFDDEWRALARRLAASAPGTTRAVKARRRRGGTVLPPRARSRCHRRVRAAVDGRRALGRGRSAWTRSGERDDARREVRFSRSRAGTLVRVKPDSDLATVDDDTAATQPAWRQRAVSRSLNAARSRAEQRVQRYLDAAFELIDEKGTTDFTIQEVIDRSKQSLRGFYQYFDGKDELLLALFEETVRESVDDLRNVIDAESEPLARLRAFTIRLHEWCDPTELPASAVHTTAVRSRSSRSSSL